MEVYFYNRYDKTKNVLQPLLQRSRQIYRGHRSSSSENLDTHQFIMDAEILRNKAIELDKKLIKMAKVPYFHDSTKAYNAPATPFFDASHRLLSVLHGKNKENSDRRYFRDLLIFDET